MNPLLIILCLLLMSSPVMAQTKITAMPSIGTIQPTDQLPIVRSSAPNNNYSTTVGNLSAQFGSALISSGMSTGATDNSSAIQSVINGLVSQMTSTQTTEGIAAIQIPYGTYRFTSGITSRPWIKLDSIGNVNLNFTGMSSGTALSVYNDDAPTGEFTTRLNASNYGPFLNGNQGGILVNGPGPTTSTVGISVGDNTTATSEANFRDASISNLVIENFGTCINLRPNNLYMLNFAYGGTAGKCANAVYATGTNTNSGERLVFRNWTFGSDANNSTCFNIDARDLDFDVGNSSCDFALYGFKRSVNALGGVMRWTNGHIENIENQIEQSSISSNANAIYSAFILDNETLVPSSLSLANNRPNRYLFTGYDNLYVHNMEIYGYAHSSNAATAGMFMVDDNMNVREFTGRFHQFAQLIQNKTLLNNDPYFSQGTVGNDLITFPMTTWTVSSSHNISAQVDNSFPLSTYGGTQDIKFTATGTSNFYVIRSNVFPVTPGQTLLADTAFYGGSSTGTDSVQLRFLFSSTNANLPQTNDGGAFGDSMSTDYSQSSDPAWLSGNLRTYQCKMNNLRQSQVPNGYNLAQLEITVSNMNFTGTPDVVYLTFAGVSGL